jgi:hypothetical protein
MAMMFLFCVLLHDGVEEGKPFEGLHGCYIFSFYCYCVLGRAIS